MMIFQSSAFAQGTTGMAYVRGSLAAPQTVASDNEDPVQFVALQEENGTFSATYFIPAHNGRYTFCASTLWDAATAVAYTWTWLVKLSISDGRAYQLSRVSGRTGGATAQFVQNTGCISVWMLSTMTAQFRIYQNTGSNRTIRNDPNETFFTIIETPMIALAQTATPQPTMTPNATIPAMATIIAGLLNPTVTPTMEPITETINISLAITNTTGISISRIPVSNTLHTTGYIYLPGWVLNFDPIAVMASLAVFILVGAVMRKPTLFVIAWFGLSILGVFSQSGIYWIFITVVMVTAVVIFLFIRHSQGD